MAIIKNHYKGKLIVFEGIDGAGTEVQSKLLLSYFKKQKRPVERLVYPDYQGPIGRLIHQYLHKEYDFSAEIQFLLYFLDFLKDQEKIKKLLKQGKTIIADRYFTSTLAYQGLKGFPVKNALKLAKIFGLSKPDLIIYLKVSPKISIKRKYKEKRSLDRHESDEKFLFKIARFYEKLIKNQTLGKWKVINGKKTIKEVGDEIKKI